MFAATEFCAPPVFFCIPMNVGMDKSQQPLPNAGDDHDPDSCDGSCGIKHDSIVPPTADCLRDVWSQLPSETTAGVIAMVTALRLGEQRAAATMIDELMEDGEYGAHAMFLQSCLILAAICSDYGVPTEHFREYAQAALLRSKGRS